MRPQLILVTAVMLALGCVTEPPPASVPEVTCSDYDVLWQATRDVVEKRFDIYAARKEKGTIVTDYKRGESIPPWEKDAQTGYDTMEEIGHIVRRKATAIITPNSEGQYALKLTIIRERHSYAPPETHYSSSYSLYERNTGQRADTIEYDNSTVWTRLADDSYLEALMLKQIQKRADYLLSRK